MRVVADTNIFISALMYRGLPGTFLDLALAGGFTLVTSPAILDELDEKLRGKFELSEEQAQVIRSKLERAANIMHPAAVLAVVDDDPDDDRILECAVAGMAEYLVTGDRHLLKLQSYEATRILTVRQFMDLFGLIP